jgi:uncharacterized protein YbjT (DUF2867 family)
LQHLKNKEKMNKILVTGSSGQMGTVVIETLLKTISAQQMGSATHFG